MNIKDVLQRDPSTHPLVNQGQARIADRDDDRSRQELRAELSTFVCEGQYAEGMQRILSSFLTNLQHTSQKGAWVSGFFGSGKSHLLKMLCHLWQDTEFPDGSTARSLVPALTPDLRALLRELDTAGKRAGGLFAAAGALPSGSTDNVRLTVLGLILRGADLPEQYAQAQFSLWLLDQGYYDRVQKAVAEAGKDWRSELNNLYVSGPIARAVLACDPQFAASEAEARKTIKAQFPQPATDISTGEFLTAIKRVLRLKGSSGRLPCTVVVLDEVQQFIGDSIERSVLVTEVAEALSKQLDSHVIVVGAGQSALSEVQLLQKLLDRFTIRVPLSDTDVETVTRKVLLQKKPSAVAQVEQVLEAHAGEVSRQLQGTRIGETADDRAIRVDDYPLLPVRRRFWEHCFRTVDLAGTQSQLRSQLRIIHDAVAKVADRPLGAVVPADELYEALAPEMVNTGVLLREINERIIGLSKDGTPAGALARRIAGLVFLIGKLPRESGADIGVHATKEHVADLLVSDLRADNGKLRSEVEVALERMVSDGALMKVGDEYRLQTREGSEWDRDFRNRQARLGNDEVTLQTERERLLYGEIGKVVNGLKVQQGQARETRRLEASREQVPPTVTGEGIPVWIRDAWSTSEREFVEAARRAGANSPIAFVFIQKQAAEELRRLVIEAKAADETLRGRGHPTTDEGQEARRGMESRLTLAMRRRDELVRQIVDNAKVFQGGGSEVLQVTLEDKLREAALASLTRLFPRFSEADASALAWDAVIKRAKDGADQPFLPVGHAGNAEDHAVCRQALGTIGTGMTGTAVRKALGGSPFGWPQDAIDAALLALHRTQHLTASLNGAPVPLGQLDQNRIAKAEFRVERATLTAAERIKVRKLFGLAGIACKSGEEAGKASEFLAAVRQLAASAGGEAPLPASPDTTDIEDLSRLVGNEQLAALKNMAAELEGRIGAWKKARELAAQRLPVWRTLEQLARHAASLPAAEDMIAQVEAVRSGRLLLQVTDPVSPLRATLAGIMRSALGEANALRQEAYAAARATLATDETWARIGAGDQARILAQVELAPPPVDDIGTDEGLISALDRESLAARRAQATAIPERVRAALTWAAKLLEPKVQAMRVEGALLRTSAELRDWLARQESALANALKRGPVQVS